MDEHRSGDPLFAGMSLEELLERAESRYRIRFERVKIGETALDILQIENMEDHIERMAAALGEDTALELPFWARIWPTSILLSYYVQRLRAKQEFHLLEIGAGIGLCGLFAAKQGFQSTISDINEDALLFSRINVLHNGLQELAEVRRVDFTRDRLPLRYDLILGSEVLYREHSYRPLIKFLNRHLRPGKDSEIILAKSYHLKARSFFKTAEKEFAIQERIIGYRGQPATPAPDKEKHLSQIYRLRPRKNPAA